MPGIKRKRINQKASKVRKQKKTKQKKDQSVANNTMTSNSTSGGEDSRGIEMDQKCNSHLEATSKNDDYMHDVDAKAKAEASKLLQQPNPAHAYGNSGGYYCELLESSSEEEEEEDCNHRKRSPFEREEKANTKTSFETTTSQRHVSTQPHFHTLDGRIRESSTTQTQFQKSPQLGRRPLSANQDNATRHIDHMSVLEKKFPGIELTSAKRRTSSVHSKSASQTSKTKSQIILYICIAIAAISLAYYLLSRSTPQPQAERTSFDEVLVKFVEKPESFLSKFPSQSKDNWRKIRSTVKATTMFALPRSPGVVAIVSLAASESVANCMGRMLAKKLQAAYNDSEFVSLRGKDYEGRDADDVKKEVDQGVRHGLGNGMHVVLLEGLHHLPAKSGLLFNGLCDNDNAPFKQAIYIFTSVTDKIVAATDQQVTTFWKKGLPEDQRHSLETRIGNNIIVVNPELNDSFYKACT